MTGFLLVFTVLYGGLTLVKGGLYIAAHEGDTYHLLDILFRMEMGQRPHADFMTPLGILVFAPVSLFLSFGFSVGTAILLAQIFVALLLLPIVVYAYRRLPTPLAYVFGAVTLGLTMAITYGGPASNLSVSMHYNRWCWAATFIVLTMALIPAGRDRTDGALIGILAACLALTKVTFFVCIVPIVGLHLLMTGRREAFMAALIAGLAVAALATFLLGPSYWTGYLSDLLTVSGSEIRPSVGMPFGEVISGAPYLGATILAGLAVALLRVSGRNAEAVTLGLLFIGFLVIVWQNFGNDPKWLMFFAVLMLMWRPTEGEGIFLGLDRRRAMTFMSLAAVALYFPAFVNLALSPVKHAVQAAEMFEPMLPRVPGHQDLYVRINRGNSMTAEVDLDGPGTVWAEYRDKVGRIEDPELAGVTFPACEFIAGSRAWLTEVTDDLVAAGIPDGSQIFNTDILTVFWLFGPYAPLEDGAPWYYGGLSGLDNADYVLVPKCRFVTRVNLITLAELNESGRRFEPVRDNDLYALFRVY